MCSSDLLLKPLEYYEEKYGTWMYGLNKLYLLMEKQHNRGQEGAGLACVKLEANPGEEYMFRERALGSGAITEIFDTVQSNFKDLTKEQLHDAGYAKRVLPFAGEVYMGHLRYSTTITWFWLSVSKCNSSSWYSTDRKSTRLNSSHT